jgi:anti-anti-sigma factor
MPVASEIYGDVGVIRLEDELTGDNIARFEGVLQGPLQEGIRNMVIDMEKTEYLDNAGLEALSELMERLQTAGGQLKFSGLAAGCRKLFEVTRLDRQADIFESLIDAVRSFH